jgi:hypothetical protein
MAGTQRRDELISSLQELSPQADKAELDAFFELKTHQQWLQSLRNRQAELEQEIRASSAAQEEHQKHVDHWSHKI